VADAFGDVVPFVIAAGLCGAALLAALRQRTAGRVAESDVAG
jgi:hypothetical protein